MNDKKILELFKDGQREKAFKKLYRLYPKIEALILSKGGSKQDASDVFQEALIILNRNLEKSDFKLTSSFYTYLYSVSRFVWKDTQKKFSKQELHNFNDKQIEYFHSVLEEKKYQLAERAFLELGERCRQLLQLFYHKAMSFKDIAKVMQFKSEKIAKNQKYKCLTKVKDIYRNSKTVQS
ncbi:sigma-70 family RNA polymerase sigma factor [Sabulilitoribacter arenilitoris]|uniref:Sigma-70 family RNA polymerase sigma factor n=1 Tax=Wocania arenilitoris TaxID=2044858 RepID=A0AAE3EN58_9FLAO|nr:sigma-70 family RNA polymerase sigma factor [Wocania arenilitoris]MCF7566910.1 sigma-70 family RNA polymerase sigma factor [Wocania arenilitoris]